jgi:UDP-N-acetylmuramyl pentapeptide phosphotransferase/UDP-N-acetylglucosamine-1-phosphate transferase
MPVLIAQMVPITAAFLCALAISVLLVATKKHHQHLTMDSAIGIQRFHIEPTSRVGGIAIYLGLLAAWIVVPDKAVKDILRTVLLAGIPVIACGLLEDITKRVGVMPRLLATMAGGVLAWLLTGIALNRLDVQGLDALMSLTPVAVLFTAFAVGGVANAINIIDGFHGVASGTAIIAMLALAAIASQVGDAQLAIACICVAAPVAGFLLVNYPWGKLFMGDGGAYFVGFALAWLAVLLVVRNPSVSAWAPLLVCSYPVIEVLYSVARRHAIRQSPFSADSGHLHSLIKIRFVERCFPEMNNNLQSALVAPIVWGFACAPAILTIAFFDRPLWLFFILMACLWLYHATHQILATADDQVFVELQKVSDS